MEKTAIQYEVVPADIDESVYDHLDLGTRRSLEGNEECGRLVYCKGAGSQHCNADSKLIVYSVVK